MIAVYGETDDVERLIPFDIVPRIFGAAEWQRLELGLKQRVRALNAFLHDIYHDQDIIKAGVSRSAHQVLDNAQYRPEMKGVDLPNQVYAHIAGIDLVRVAENDFYVLEDNLRTPSGVSYMLENRKTMMRLFPELFVKHTIEPVEHYPQMLLNTLREAAPPNVAYPVIVVMTPGAYNSAVFRTCLPRQSNGRGTGRRPGSVRTSTEGLHAHHRGSATSACDLPPGG